MLLVFQMVFSVPLISQIESTGGGRGGGNGWEAEGRSKQPFRLKEQCCAFSVTQTDTIHKGGQDWGEEQPGTPCSSISTS